MEIRRVDDIDAPDLIALVQQSDDYLAALYPPESNHAESLQMLVSNQSAFFAGYLGSSLVACGAVKLQQDDVPFGEIKRVFVDPAHRGKRLATQMMQHLETYLRQRGTSIVRLEAGPRQPEALKLYQKLGYKERGPFGRYRPDPLSVFMEKQL